MPLLDRVTTLIRANLNDLVDKAEDPEKLLKQLLLDMQNQFMQVKTQLAIAIADQHLLDKKRAESLSAQNEWLRKAEMALERSDENLARSALERSLSFETAARNFAQQVESQTQHVRMFREALERLEDKMTETRAKAEALIAQHRRARLAARAGAAAMKEWEHDAAFDRLRAKISEAEALSQGQHLAATESSVDHLFSNLEKSDRVERLLSDLKLKAITDGRD